jgi:hypothetical protein
MLSNRHILQQRHPAGSRKRAASGLLTTKSSVTNFRNAKPEATKIANRPAETLNKGDHVPPAKRPKPAPQVAVTDTPPIGSVPQRMTANQPVDPKDIHSSSTVSRGIKENQATKMKPSSTTNTGNKATRPREQQTQPEVIDLLDDANDVRVKRVFFDPLELKSSLSSYSTLAVEGSRGFIIKYDFEKEEKIPFNAVLAFQ